MTSFANNSTPTNSRAFHTKFLGNVLKNIFPVSSSNPHYDSWATQYQNNFLTIEKIPLQKKIGNHRESFFCVFALLFFLAKQTKNSNFMLMKFRTHISYICCCIQLGRKAFANSPRHEVLIKKNRQREGGQSKSSNRNSGESFFSFFSPTFFRCYFFTVTITIILWTSYFVVRAPCLCKVSADCQASSFICCFSKPFDFSWDKVKEEKSNQLRFFFEMKIFCVHGSRDLKLQKAPKLVFSFFFARCVSSFCVTLSQLTFFSCASE